MARRGKVKRREQRTRQPSLSKGVVGKFQIAHKPDRFDRAKILELKLKEPDGKGTHRGHGSNLALRMKATALKGRDKMRSLRRRHKYEKSRSKRSSK